MTLEEAIHVADESLLAHFGNPLTDIQRMILRESLAGKGYERMEGYSSHHIKNEGKNLWDLLSEALGEKVSKPSFKGALEKRLKSGSMVPKPPQPSNYNEQTWAGREALVSDLLLKLQGQTRLLWITGLSGVGKTALGECLASQAWASDPSFQWIYLEILEGQNADFASVAATLLAKLGDRDLDSQERNDPEQLAKRLLKKLQAHPYWIQLDALERLLNPEQPTKFVDGYWTIFLQRCLTESNLASRLMLTAQALPDALGDFGDRYPNTWTEIRLSGLSEGSQQIEFFTKRGVVVEEPNQEILTRIAAIYEGHPLVLKVIAEDILKEYAGDVLYYWQVNQREFEQVARELRDARLDETEYNEALDRKVRERIKKSLEQLPVDALNLLCRSSVFRCPVPKKFWLAMINDRSPNQQKEAYRVLGDRALIEKENIHRGQFLIRQHNLIRDVAYDLLKQDSSMWKSTERKATELWLTAYKPDSNVPNLEKVRGYLEAFHHFCTIENWKDAIEILLGQRWSSTNHLLGWQLGLWGYYKEQVKLHKRLLNSKNLDDIQQCICLNNLGHAFRCLGQYIEAIKCHKYQLKAALEITKTCPKTSTLRKLEANAIGNLGSVYYARGEYHNAVICYEQQLTVAREISDSNEEEVALSNLGSIHASMGNYPEAISYYRENFILIQKTGSQEGEGHLLANQGASQVENEQYEDALESLEQSLKIFKEKGIREGEAIVLKNLATLHQRLGEARLSQRYCEQSLAIATELGIPLAEECRQLKEEMEKHGGEKGR